MLEEAVDTPEKTLDLAKGLDAALEVEEYGREDFVGITEEWVDTMSESVSERKSRGSRSLLAKLPQTIVLTELFIMVRGRGTSWDACEQSTDSGRRRNSPRRTPALQFSNSLRVSTISRSFALGRSTSSCSDIMLSCGRFPATGGVLDVVPDVVEPLGDGVSRLPLTY